jgi:hypothetical protein
MKKRNILIVASIASVFALTGCVNESADGLGQVTEKAVGKDEVQKAVTVKDDLLTYMNESLTPLAEQEGEVIALYDSVTGANYTDDETTYNTIADEIMPKYQVFIKDLEEVEMETEEVTNIHEIYIEAVNIQQSGFVTMLSAIKEQDLEKINDANAKLTEARTMSRDYLNKLQSLAKENDVVLEKE